MVLECLGFSAPCTPKHSRKTPVVTGYESLGWHDYYSVAFTDRGVVGGSSTQNIYLDFSLFDQTPSSKHGPTKVSAFAGDSPPDFDQE